MREFIEYVGFKTIKLYLHITKKKKIENKIQRDVDEKVTTKLLKDKQYNPPIKKIIFLICIGVILCIFNITYAIEVFMITLLYILFKRNLPKYKKEKKRKDILKVIPYVLRELSIELKAGIGLFDAIEKVSNGNYGQLSKEFKITLNEIKYGTNYIEAFENLSKRINLPIMEKIVSHMNRTIINGGNLADTLNILANENSRNMQIKYKEYSEKLNSLMILYMFTTVVIPVILFIMIIAATTVIGPIVKAEILLVLYLFFFPIIIVFFIIIIKRLEPTL